VTNVTKEVLDMLIVKFVQRNINRQNALVTFSTKSVSLLFKNVCEVWGISCSDLLPSAFWCLDVFRWLSIWLWLLHHNHLIALGMVISTNVQKLADIAKQIMCKLY